MAEYRINLDEARDNRLTWLNSKGGTGNEATLQSLVEQKLDEYISAYRDEIVKAVKDKIDYAAQKEELKADYASFMAKVDAQIAADAEKEDVGGVGVAEEPVTP
jgi:hypothetical protein